MNRTYKYWVENLHMTKHPEGGYYKENYINPESITDSELNVTFEGKRSLATSIYFLINGNNSSKFHRLKSDEMWYYHDGVPLSIYVITPSGELKVHRLGLDFENGQMPQILVPAGSIFGSCIENSREEDYSLVGCMVSFGFQFEDFELFSTEELLKLYPQHKTIIERLT